LAEPDGEGREINSRRSAADCGGLRPEDEDETKTKPNLKTKTDYTHARSSVVGVVGAVGELNPKFRAEKEGFARDIGAY